MFSPFENLLFPVPSNQMRLLKAAGVLEQELHENITVGYDEPLEYIIS